MAGQAVLPVILVAVSLVLIPGGSVLSSPSFPLSDIVSSPSPSHPHPSLRWTVAPRDVLLGADLARLSVTYLLSSVTLYILSTVAPAPKVVFTPNPSDPRKTHSERVTPMEYLAAAIAFYLASMRVLALRTIPEYTAALASRAASPKTSKQFSDLPAVGCAIMGFLLIIREMSNFAERFGEFSESDTTRRAGLTMQKSRSTVMRRHWRTWSRR